MSTYDYNTYSSYDTSAAGAILGGAFLIVGLIFLVAAAISVIGIIGQWKAFKKAGKNGWEAIIPFYNLVVACQISGVSPWWVLIYLLGTTVLNVIPVIGSFAALACSVYFLILLNVSVARSFGKETGFAVGLIFLNPIFWFVLGGNNVQYVGPTPMNDVVMGMFNKNGNGSANNGYQQPMNNGYQQPMNNGYQQPMNNGFQQPMNNNFQQPMNSAPAAPQAPSDVKFCTACGYKVTNGERFCPGCGKEVL